MWFNFSPLTNSVPICVNFLSFVVSFSVYGAVRVYSRAREQAQPNRLYRKTAALNGT